MSRQAVLTFGGHQSHSFFFGLLYRQLHAEVTDDNPWAVLTIHPSRGGTSTKKRLASMRGTTRCGSVALSSGSDWEAEDRPDDTPSGPCLFGGLHEDTKDGLRPIKEKRGDLRVMDCFRICNAALRAMMIFEVKGCLGQEVQDTDSAKGCQLLLSLVIGSQALFNRHSINSWLASLSSNTNTPTRL
uniref:Uncharacterized protein n=1 Tax=Timema poppense TaxID=170557 RepID=A0A7R9H057_TIMPO|nr:unnamed protein product [Timema poppensis]